MKLQSTFVGLNKASHIFRKQVQKFYLVYCSVFSKPVGTKREQTEGGLNGRTRRSQSEKKFVCNNFSVLIGIYYKHNPYLTLIGVRQGTFHRLVLFELDFDS